MKSLTKGIFSSLVTLAFLFSPVESINSSTFKNSLFETLGDVQENLVIESQIALSDNTGGKKNETNQESDAKPNIRDKIKSWADASWSIFLNVVFWSLFLGLLFLLWGLATTGKGTIVLPFKDLTEKNNALQGINQEQSQNKNQDKLKEESKIEKIIPELLVAELYKIRHIYELAGQCDKQFIQGLHVSDPDICIDTKILSSNKDNLKDLLDSDSFPIIKFSSGDLAENIGEITELGFVVGKISLGNLIAFLQQILPNIFTGLGSRKKRTITGSIQGCDNNLRLVAHMESEKHFRAWEILPGDIDNSNNSSNKENHSGKQENHSDKLKLVSGLVEKLAYKIADQLSGYPIGNDNFKKFTDLLKSYSQYKRSQNKELPEDLTTKCIEFFEKEPTDIRSFGLLYNLGIAALTNEQNQTAEDLFRNAISLEPHIVQRICELQIPLNKLKWSKEKQREVENTYKMLRLKLNKDLNPLNQCLSKSKSLWLRLFWNRFFLNNEGKALVRWAESISYALNALGQTLEIKCQPGLCGKDVRALQLNTLPLIWLLFRQYAGILFLRKSLNRGEKENSNTANKSKDGDKNENCYVNLGESMEAYERASQLAINDALYLSNLASLKIENVNLLAKVTYLKESVLKEAKEHLNKAIKDNKIKKNRHLAFNRLGNLYHEQGNYNNAISNYEEALKTKKDFVVVYRNLGLLYLDKRDFENTIRKFEEGIKILTDDELFHGNIYYKQLHGWLHNGIGWTYLMRAIDSNHTSQSYSIQNSSDLTRAEHELQEAIVIFSSLRQCKSDIPLYVPYFNLGHVYAWRGKKKEAWQEWQKGLELCNKPEPKNEHQTFFKMMSEVYKFASEETYQKKSQKDFDKIEKELNNDILHWRFRNCILYDALAVKKSISYLKNNLHSNKENFTNILKDIKIIIALLENSLPSFNLGLAYLWRNKHKAAEELWRRKTERLCDKIKDFDNKIIIYHTQKIIKSSKYNCTKKTSHPTKYIYDKIQDFNNYIIVYYAQKIIESSNWSKELCDSNEHIYDQIQDFNNRLWFYIYETLVYIIQNHKEIRRRESDAALATQFIFLYIYPPYILQEMYSQDSWQFKYIEPYMNIYTFSKNIDWEIQKIRKYVTFQNNPTIKQIYEVLDDIKDKFEILKHGPNPFQEKWVRDQLKKVFEPILSCHKDLKKYLKKCK